MAKKIPACSPARPLGGGRSSLSWPSWIGSSDTPATTTLLPDCYKLNKRKMNTKWSSAPYLVLLSHLYPAWDGSKSHRWMLTLSLGRAWMQIRAVRSNEGWCHEPLRWEHPQKIEAVYRTSLSDLSILKIWKKEVLSSQFRWEAPILVFHWVSILYLFLVRMIWYFHMAVKI